MRIIEKKKINENISLKTSDVLSGYESGDAIRIEIFGKEVLWFTFDKLNGLIPRSTGFMKKFSSEIKNSKLKTIGPDVSIIHIDSLEN